MSIKPKVTPFTPDPSEAVLNADLKQLSEIIDRHAPGKGRAVIVDILHEFAGTYIYFIQPDTPFKESRDRWIIEQYSRGCRVAEIARVIGMSESQVWHILGKVPEDSRQIKLF